VALGPGGSTFPVSLTAQQIFDSADPTTNVFTSLNSLITALQNNDQTAAQTIQGGLSGVAQYLNNQLAFYGTTQDKVTSATNDAATQQTGIQAQIGGLEDADTTSAILDMTQLQTQEQAALQSRANIPRSTLFDFLG
jgi:flagellin-like hook-associated protein FlgL